MNPLFVKVAFVLPMGFWGSFPVTRLGVYGQGSSYRVPERKRKEGNAHDMAFFDSREINNNPRLG